MKDHTRLHLPPTRRAAVGVHDAIALADTTRRIWRHKWRIAAVTVLFGAVGLLVAQVQMPVYQSRAVIVLDPRGHQMTGGTALVPDLELSTPIVDTQIAILRSPALLSEVMSEIGQDQLAEYYRTAEVARTDASLIARTLAHLRPAPVPADTDTHFSGWTMQAQGGLSVNRLGSSYAIEVVTQAPDPTLAADIANGLVTRYVEGQLAERIVLAEQATVWLTAQVDEGAQALAAAEQQLQLMTSTALAANRVAPDVIDRQIVIQTAQLVPLRAEANAAAEYLALLQATPDAVDSETVAQLRAEIVVLEQQDSVLAQRLGVNHPDRVALTARRDGVAMALRAEVTHAIGRARLAADLLAARAIEQSAALHALEEQRMQMTNANGSSQDLERHIEALRVDQTARISRLDEARAQIDQQRAEARILARAEAPRAPTAPRSTLITAFAGFTGLTIALILSAILDGLHPGFRRIAQVETVTGYDVITQIPKSGSRSARAGLRLLGKDPYSGFAERIRQMRTAILAPASVQGKCVLLTSSHSDEGTTPVALAVAQSCAQNGYLTLYLDLNTRASASCEMFGLGQKSSLTDHLIGQCTLNQAVHHPDGVDFKVLAPAAHDPLLADALTVTDIDHLLTDLRQQFAVIIVDSPPVLDVPDALVIAPAVDEVIYLIAAGTTRRTDVMRGLAAFERLDLGLSGIVMTGAAGAHAYNGQSGDLI